MDVEMRSSQEARMAASTLSGTSYRSRVNSVRVRHREKAIMTESTATPMKIGTPWDSQIFKSS
jgi:hypothetical protein